MNISLKSKIYSFLAVALLSAGIFAQATPGLPDKPGSWVNDYAGVLSDNERQTLDNMLADLQQRSSNQIFIAILNQLPENYYLEDYAADLYKKWKLGLADQDNGILLVIAINDHKVRFEIGYGLEDVVTDAQSATLIRNYLAPEFRQGNYFAGIKSVLDILIPAVEGKYKIPVEGSNDGFTLSPGMIIAIFILFIFISMIFNTRRSVSYGPKGKRSYYDGPFWWGGGGGSGGGFGGGFGGGGGFSGGFSGGFGGSSGGGGASGSW